MTTTIRTPGRGGQDIAPPQEDLTDLTSACTLGAPTMRPPFRSTQRVYFDDLDALNILHNVRFMLIFERARGELFNALGFRWIDDVSVNPDKHHVVAAHSITYLEPVRGEGEVVAEILPTKLGSSSFLLDMALTSVDGKTLHARGNTRLVRLDPTTNRPCPWSPRMREAMAPWLDSP